MPEAPLAVFMRNTSATGYPDMSYHPKMVCFVFSSIVLNWRANVQKIQIICSVSVKENCHIKWLFKVMWFLDNRRTLFDDIWFHPQGSFPISHLLWNDPQMYPTNGSPFWALWHCGTLKQSFCTLQTLLEVLQLYTCIHFTLFHHLCSWC